MDQSQSLGYDYSNLIMVNPLTGIAAREPVDSNVFGLSPEDLLDLSPFNILDRAWWPGEDQSLQLARWERYGEEVLTADPVRRVVVVVRPIVAWTPQEIEDEMHRVWLSVRDAIRQRMDIFAGLRDYHEIAEAISFQSSSIQELAVQGQHAAFVRDQMMIAYEAAKAIPDFQPFGIADLDAQNMLPLFTDITLAWPT